MTALENWVNAYRNTAVGDTPPVDVATYLDAVEEFGALVMDEDPRAIASYTYAELQMGHDPKDGHTHSSEEKLAIMRQALEAYAGSIEEGWEAG